MKIWFEVSPFDELVSTEHLWTSSNHIEMSKQGLFFIIYKLNFKCLREIANLFLCLLSENLQEIG